MFSHDSVQYLLKLSLQHKTFFHFSSMETILLIPSGSNTHCQPTFNYLLLRDAELGNTVPLLEYLSCTDEKSDIKLILSAFQFAVNQHGKRKIRIIGKIEVDFNITSVECILNVFNKMSLAEYLDCI